MEWKYIKTGDIDFNLNEVTRDELSGPNVTLVRMLFNGDTEITVLPVAVAMLELLTNPDNGRVYKSGHIEFDGVFDNWPIGYEII